MGKSKGGKKKGGGPNKPLVNGGNVSDAQKRAQVLKEVGNAMYQGRDYSGALEHYSKGLRLLPEDHADRAVFHSNRAACLMQINPNDHEKVIDECSLALKIQPGFTRALLRRARAFESSGKIESAVEDVNEVLKSDPSHKEAKEMARQLTPSTKDPVKKKKKEKDCSDECSSDEYEEVEMDDWLFDFAQIFRSSLDIDPATHINLSKLGLDLCSKALEKTLKSDEAQPLFDQAAEKFQEATAFALLGWGNVYLGTVERFLPLEESATKETYEWVKQRYMMAKEKFDQALSIKPDFHEGWRALGLQQFEMAKLNCSFALQQKIDLSVWDATETFKLFDEAEEKTKAAIETWEKREGDGEPEEASDVSMTLGNILFERSQLEYETGVSGWEKNLESALEIFRLCGASETEVSGFVEGHCSNQPARKGDEKEDEKAKGDEQEHEKEDEKAKGDEQEDEKEGN